MVFQKGIAGTSPRATSPLPTGENSLAPPVSPPKEHQSWTEEFRVRWSNDRFNLPALLAIDVEAMQRKVDLPRLQQVLKNAVFGGAHPKVFEGKTTKEVVHMVRVFQILLQYLIFSQRQLVHQMQQLRNEVSAVKEEREADRNAPQPLDSSAILAQAEAAAETKRVNSEIKMLKKELAGMRQALIEAQAKAVAVTQNAGTVPHAHHDTLEVLRTVADLLGKAGHSTPATQTLPSVNDTTGALLNDIIRRIAAVEGKAVSSSTPTTPKRRQERGDRKRTRKGSRRPSRDRVVVPTETDTSSTDTKSRTRRERREEEEHEAMRRRLRRQQLEEEEEEWRRRMDARRREYETRREQEEQALAAQREQARELTKQLLSEQAAIREQIEADRRRAAEEKKQREVEAEERRRLLQESLREEEEALQREREKRVREQAVLHAAPTIPLSMSKSIPTDVSPLPSNPAPIPASGPQRTQQPAPQPAHPAPQPAQPAPQPAQPTPQPAQPTPQPAQPTPQPAQPTPQPAQPAPQPAQPAPTSQPQPLPATPQRGRSPVGAAVTPPRTPPLTPHEDSGCDPPLHSDSFLRGRTKPTPLSDFSSDDNGRYTDSGGETPPRNIAQTFAALDKIAATNKGKEPQQVPPDVTAASSALVSQLEVTSINSETTTSTSTSGSPAKGEATPGGAGGTAVVQCKFCLNNVRAATLEEHMEQCDFRYTDCDACGEEVEFNELSLHRTICPARNSTPGGSKRYSQVFAGGQPIIGPQRVSVLPVATPESTRRASDVQPLHTTSSASQMLEQSRRELQMLEEEEELERSRAGPHPAQTEDID